jgi:hypothetical protein
MACSWKRRGGREIGVSCELVVAMCEVVMIAEELQNVCLEETNHELT